jgi:hypothetical protein
VSACASGKAGLATWCEHALWSFELIETYRKSVRPDLRRIIIGVDPSGTKGSEDRGDHVGIVVVGLGLDRHAHDCSVKASPATWGTTDVAIADPGGPGFLTSGQHCHKIAPWLDGRCSQGARPCASCKSGTASGRLTTAPLRRSAA